MSESIASLYPSRDLVIFIGETPADGDTRPVADEVLDNLATSTEASAVRSYTSSPGAMLAARMVGEQATPAGREITVLRGIDCGARKY